MRSFWETDLIQQTQLVIVGAGFTACHLALALNNHWPKLKISLFEEKSAFAGASSSNAGFLCYGSPSELLSDIKKNGEDRAIPLLKLRWKGMGIVKNRYPEKVEANCKAYELFQTAKQDMSEEVLDSLDYLNGLLRDVIGQSAYRYIDNHKIEIKGEGRCQPAALLIELHNLLASRGINIYRGHRIKFPDEEEGSLSFGGVDLKPLLCIHCGNGYAQMEESVSPARAQCLVTKPLSHKLSGNYHQDAGFLYYRDFGNRIVIGGHRNLDPESEETAVEELNPLIQNALDKSLAAILNVKEAKEFVAQRWSGIMGFNTGKMPILKEERSGYYSLLGMSGMGVALSAAMAEHATRTISESGLLS